MKTIKLVRYRERDYDYTVVSPDPDDENLSIDYSGTYVLAIEVEAASAKEKSECDKAMKRSGERWKALDAEIQNHNITKSQLTVAEAKIAELRAAFDRVTEREDGLQEREQELIKELNQKKIDLKLAPEFLGSCQERERVLVEEVNGMQELPDRDDIKKTKLLQEILRLQKVLSDISCIALAQVKGE